MNAELKQFTLWRDPRALIRSQHGLLPWQVYLEREILRVHERAPDRLLEIRENLDGQIALFCEDLPREPKYLKTKTLLSAGA